MVSKRKRLFGKGLGSIDTILPFCQRLSGGGKLASLARAFLAEQMAQLAQFTLVAGRGELGVVPRRRIDESAPTGGGGVEPQGVVSATPETSAGW